MKQSENQPLLPQKTLKEKFISILPYLFQRCLRNDLEEVNSEESTSPIPINVNDDLVGTNLMEGSYTFYAENVFF